MYTDRCPCDYGFLLNLNCIQVAVAAVIFEVQRSSRSEARREEKRKQDLEVCNRSMSLFFSYDCNP